MQVSTEEIMPNIREAQHLEIFHRCTVSYYPFLRVCSNSLSETETGQAILSPNLWLLWKIYICRSLFEVESSNCQKRTIPFGKSFVQKLDRKVEMTPTNDRNLFNATNLLTIMMPNFNLFFSLQFHGQIVAFS